MLCGIMFSFGAVSGPFQGVLNLAKNRFTMTYVSGAGSFIHKNKQPHLHADKI